MSYFSNLQSYIRYFGFGFVGEFSFQRFVRDLSYRTTNHSTFQKPQNHSINISVEHKIRWSTEFEAHKLRKVWSGKPTFLGSGYKCTSFMISASNRVPPIYPVNNPFFSLSLPFLLFSRSPLQTAKCVCKKKGTFSLLSPHSKEPQKPPKSPKNIKKKQIKNQKRLPEWYRQQRKTQQNCLK